MEHSVLMARQPIYDNKLNVVAYELLYRSSGIAAMPLPTSWMAIWQPMKLLLTITPVFFESGRMKKLPAFLNLTKEMVASDMLPSLSKENIVFEILSDVEVDENLIQGVKRLADYGYRLALDDVICKPEYDSILELVDIVKVDLKLRDDAQLISDVAKLKQYDVTLLAEKIETHEEFELCSSLGFELFQGYFLCKPIIVEGRKLSANEFVVLQLMNVLNDPGVKPDQFEEIIRTNLQDPENCKFHCFFTGKED